MNTQWHKMYLGEWAICNNAVFSSYRIQRWLESGEIDRKEAEILLRLTYDQRDGKAYVER